MVFSTIIFSNYNEKLLGDKFYNGECFIRVIVFWHRPCPDFYWDFCQWITLTTICLVMCACTTNDCILSLKLNKANSLSLKFYIMHTAACINMYALLSIWCVHFAGHISCSSECYWWKSQYSFLPQGRLCSYILTEQDYIYSLWLLCTVAVLHIDHFT